MKIIAIVALLQLAQSIRVEDEKSIFFQGSIQDFFQATQAVINADEDDTAGQEPKAVPKEKQEGEGEDTKTADGGIMHNGDKLTPMVKPANTDGGKPATPDADGAKPAPDGAKPAPAAAKPAPDAADGAKPALDAADGAKPAPAEKGDGAKPAPAAAKPAPDGAKPAPDAADGAKPTPAEKGDGAKPAHDAADGAKPALDAADGAKPAPAEKSDGSKIEKMGTPEQIKKDPKKMKELMDVIKKIMGHKKGQRPKGMGGGGGMGGKGGGGMGGGGGGGHPGGGGEKGGGQVDNGPEPPLTKVYENTQLSVKCDKGKCQVKECKSGSCKNFEKKQMPSMEFQKADQNWDKKTQLTKDKDAAINIGGPPAKNPVPQATQDQFAEGEVSVLGEMETTTQLLSQSLKITQIGQDTYDIEF